MLTAHYDNNSPKFLENSALVWIMCLNPIISEWEQAKKKAIQYFLPSLNFNKVKQGIQKLNINEIKKLTHKLVLFWKMCSKIDPEIVL